MGYRLKSSKVKIRVKRINLGPCLRFFKRKYISMCKRTRERKELEKRLLKMLNSMKMSKRAKTTKGIKLFQNKVEIHKPKKHLPVVNSNNKQMKVKICRTIQLRT